MVAADLPPLPPVLAGVPAPGAGSRLAAEVLTGEERWVADGWRASTWLPGRAGPARRWTQLLETAGAFTAAVAHLPRPTFLDQRTHPWALADRAVWEGQDLDTHRDLDALLARLRALVPPGSRTSRPCQLAHGDMAGNVLFAPGLAPWVIDISPSWRPAHRAASVIVADALLGWDQDADLVRTLHSPPPC